MSDSPPPGIVVEGQHLERCGHCKRLSPCNRHLFIYRYDTEIFVPLCATCADDLDHIVMEFAATGHPIRISAS